MNQADSEISQHTAVLSHPDAQIADCENAARQVLDEPKNFDALINHLGQCGEYSRFLVIKRVLAISNRLQRNVLLTQLVNSPNPPCKIDALAFVNETELPQLRKLLESRGFKEQADDAAAFAISQLANETKTINHVRGWLNKVAYHKALALKSSQEKKAATATEGYEEIGGLTEHIETTYVETVRTTCDLVNDCRKNVLNEQEDQVLEYHYFQERSAKEISELMQMPLATVYHRLKQAAMKLKSCVEAKRG
ncbi:MAG: sigma-70 family RNA polymerase sigma factor [Pirellulaceae bacterium]